MPGHLYANRIHTFFNFTSIKPTMTTFFSNCASHTHSSHMTYRANETAIARYRLVKLLSDGFSVAIAGTSDRPIGISTDEADPGEMLDIALLCSSDTISARTSAPIQAGDILVPSSEGCVQKLPATAGNYWQIGIALHAAANASLVELMPCVPTLHMVTE
jgi:hypothetical protein